MTLLRKVSIKSRFYILITTTISALFLTIILNLVILKNSLYEFKKHAISQVVESSTGIAKYFYGLEDNGILSRETAKKYTSGAVKKMRFDNKNYVHILTSEGIGVMHPVLKDFSGKDITYITDKNGKKVVLAHLEAIDNPNKEGFSYYFWPEPNNPDTVSEKYAFNKVFEPWQWIFNAGDFSNSINTELTKTARVLAIGFSISIVFLLIFFLVVMRSILSPLKNFSDTVDRAIGHSN